MRYSFASKHCVPGAGIHAHGPFGFAVFDAALTVIAAWLFSRFVCGNFWIVLPLSFVLGISVHRALRVDTALNVLIFGKLGDTGVSTHIS